VAHELDVGAAATASERGPQRVQDEVGAHVRRELPADGRPRPHVDDKGEEHDALPAAQ
jgi:hypothetical protein